MRELLAEKHDDEDRTKAVIAGLRSEADGVMIRVEAFLTDFGDSLSASTMKRLNEAREKMEQSLSGDVDVTVAKAAIAALDTELADAVSSVGIPSSASSETQSSSSKAAYANA